MTEKKIHIYYINHIKRLDYKIFEYEDDDYPDYRAVKNCENQIKKWLDKAGITDKDLRQEVLSVLSWCDDKCCEKLEELGWTILKGEIKK